jgi:beta-glucosidase
MANDDKPGENGEVDDQARIDFTDEYLRCVKKAVCDGVPIIGYQHWSLMDNFEWAEGYDPRFGLIYVDFNTGKRTIKKSGLHYRRIIETNGEAL